MDTLRLRGRTPWIALPLIALALTIAFVASSNRASGAVSPPLDTDVDAQLGAVSPPLNTAVDVQLGFNFLFVSWASDAAEDGTVEYGPTGTIVQPGDGTVATDVRGALGTRVNQNTHFVEITGLAAGTYDFIIDSGGTIAGPFPVTLPTAISDSSFPASNGVVFRQGGVNPALECLVSTYVTNSVGDRSAAIISITDGTAGSYSATLSSLYTEDYSGKFSFALPDTDSATVTITSEAKCGDGEFGSFTGATADITQANLPNGTVVAYTGVDFEVAPLPAWSIADQAFDEGVGSAEVQFNLSQVSGVDETIQFVTSNGTATIGEDFGTQSSGLQVSGSAVVLAGMTSTTSSVPIIDDPKDEIDEDFTITLSSPTGSGDALIADGTGVMTINDNDAPPLASVPGTFTVPEPGDNTTSLADVPVTLSEISDFQVTVNYSTTDITADSSEDYVAASGSVIIAPGSSSANISITING